MKDDILLAKKYLAKVENARKRGIAFELSLSDFKRLLKIKRCQYSNIPFFIGKAVTEQEKWFIRSIERVDPSKGYTKDNVVVVCLGINNFKSLWEDPNNPLDMKMVTKIVGNINKRLK